MEKFYNSTKYRNILRAKEAIYHTCFKGIMADSAGGHRKPGEKSHPGKGCPKKV